MARPTLKDLAKQLGVDASLVSRVLRSDPEVRVSKAKREKIIALAAKTRYRPNHVGRSLQSKRTRIVAMVVPDITNPFYAALFRSVETVALDRGYSVILCNTDEQHSRSERLLDVLGDGHVDGWVVASARQADPNIQALAAASIPYVILNRRTDVRSVPWVGPDDFQSGVVGGRHLLERGHRRISYITAELEITSMRLRLEGFLAAAKSFACPVDDDLIVVDRLIGGDMRERVSKLLRDSSRRPTALFVSNSVHMHGVVAAIRELGLLIPQDISVIGYNPLPDAFFSGVSVPVPEMGRIGMNWLIDRVEQPNTAEILNVTLPVSFVDRGTSSRPPA